MRDIQTYILSKLDEHIKSLELEAVLTSKSATTGKVMILNGLEIKSVISYSFYEDAVQFYIGGTIYEVPYLQLLKLHGIFARIEGQIAYHESLRR